MIKVKDLAIELNKTPRALQQRINKDEGFKEKHIKVINRAWYIDDEGMRMLREHFANDFATEKAPEPDKKEDDTTAQILEMLKQELKSKNAEIERLNEHIEHLSVLIDQEQKLHADTKRQLLELQAPREDVREDFANNANDKEHASEAETEPKKRRWRIFKRSK